MVKETLLFISSNGLLTISELAHIRDNGTLGLVRYRVLFKNRYLPLQKTLHDAFLLCSLLGADEEEMMKKDVRAMKGGKTMDNKPDPKDMISISEKIWADSKHISEQAAIVAVAATGKDLDGLLTAVMKLRTMCRLIDERSALLRMYAEGVGREAPDGE